MNKIKILVVDDSILIRKIISVAINENDDMEVIATATNPFEARDAIIKYRPDVMTLDIEMPKMNGIEFLRQLLPQYKIPVIVCSSLSEAVIDALGAGAVDFISKPTVATPKKLQEFFEKELISKIRSAASSNIIIKKQMPKSHQSSNSEEDENRTEVASVSSNKAAVFNKNIKNILGGPPKERVVTPEGEKWKNKIIAIGASTGGTEAIFNVIKAFDSNVSIPGIVITQHMPPGFTTMYSQRLDRQCKMCVREAKTGDEVLPGLALIAPGDAHLEVYREKGVYKVKCFKGQKVSGHCPSVDVMFESVAKTAGKNAIGIILTGMGADGAKGLLSMRSTGAETIGQNEETCVVYGMPKVAYEIGAVKYQLPLTGIAQKVYQLLPSLQV